MGVNAFILKMDYGFRRDVKRRNGLRITADQFIDFYLTLKDTKGITPDDEDFFNTMYEVDEVPGRELDFLILGAKTHNELFFSKES